MQKVSAVTPRRKSLLTDGMGGAGEIGAGTPPLWGGPNIFPTASVTGAAPETPTLAPPDPTGTQLCVEGICQLWV